MEYVVVVALGGGFEVIFVLLVHDGDGNCFSGSESGGVGMDTVPGAEGDIVRCDNFCFSHALCLWILTQTAREKEGPVTTICGMIGILVFGVAGV